MTMRTSQVVSARLDRLIHERVHDPYRNLRKPSEPSVCPTCNAVFRQGRWQWLESWPANSHQVLCQACRRIRDNYPAGLVFISGGFVASHRDEILALVRNQEELEKNQHALHRIMRIGESPGTIAVKTTDIHLPRRIGDALRRAFKGELTLNYDEDGCYLRALWRREE